MMYKNISGNYLSLKPRRKSIFKWQHIYSTEQQHKATCCTFRITWQFLQNRYKATKLQLILEILT